MPDAEVVKNRVHLDIHVSGSRSDPLATRKQRVDAEAKRLTDLGAIPLPEFASGANPAPAQTVWASARASGGAAR
jgi:hypothetical protein